MGLIVHKIRHRFKTLPSNVNLPKSIFFAMTQLTSYSNRKYSKFSYTDMHHDIYCSSLLLSCCTVFFKKLQRMASHYFSIPVQAFYYTPLTRLTSFRNTVFHLGFHKPPSSCRPGVANLLIPCANFSPLI